MTQLVVPLILLVLTSCSELATQSPTVNLHEVHPNGARRLAFDPDSTRLASGGVHGDLLIWSLDNYTVSRALNGHADGIRGLAWLDSNRLVSADRGGEIRLWDVQRGDVVASARVESVAEIAWSPGAQDWLLVAGGRSLHKLALPSLRPVTGTMLPGRVLSVAVNHAADRVAVSTRDGRVSLLDSSLSRVETLPAASRDALDLHFSPDDRTLVAGGWFRLLVWDLQRQTLEERPTEHRGLIVSLDISPDGTQWISLGRQTDSAFRLTDAESGQVVRRMQAHQLCGWQARFSPSGRYAASSAEDGSIHIYDLTDPYRPVVRYPEF